MSAAMPRFEQVSVEVARKVAERERMNSLALASICAICGREVSLEQCKVDEYGAAVHDGCYVKKVLM